MHGEAPFEILTDGAGTVSLGWLTEKAFFVRMVGELSEVLGLQFARYLQRMMSTNPGAEYFLDTRELTNYDLAARSAFFKVVLSHRRDFDALVILVWPGVIGYALKAVIHSLGVRSELLQDRLLFEERLLRAAPAARVQLREQAIPLSGRFG